MATAGPLPYLQVSGTEIGNAARTLSYLRRGLGETMQGHWEIGVGDVCGVLYRVDGSGCTPAVFLSPASDPAPWYDPTEPGAATFLGLVLLDIQGYDSTVYRGVDKRLGGLGGGVFSGQHRNPRTWKFRGAMVSADDAGAEYGLRWLTSALESSFCDECALGWLAVRLVCPPENCSNETLGLWYSYDVALTDGPHEVEPYSPRSQAADRDVLAGCRDYIVVEWTMAAANPFLYKPTVVQKQLQIAQQTPCTDICTFLFGTSTPQCVLVAPPKRGVLGSIFNLTSTAGFGGVFLSAYKNCGSNVIPTEAPDLQIHLSEIPAHSTVVVDSSQHKITVYQTDPVTGAVSVGDGSFLVVLPPNKTIEWLELANCGTVACFCVSAEACAEGTLNVTILTQQREG